MENEEKVKIHEQMRDAIFNARGCMDAHDLIEKYELDGGKDFVLKVLEDATDAENKRSRELHDKLFAPKV